jgi:hypothetical protein
MTATSHRNKPIPAEDLIADERRLTQMNIDEHKSTEATSVSQGGLDFRLEQAFDF